MKPAAGAPRLERGLPWLLALALLLGGASQLDQYSISWDEGLGDLFFGQRYLSFVPSFDAKYLDFDADPYPARFSPDLSMSPFRHRPWEYYPFANLLGAATSVVLSRWLGIFDPFDGFHAVNLWLAAILVVVLYRFAARRDGLLAAAVATTSLFLLPRVVCDLLANTKDLPTMVLCALVLLVFQIAYERGSTRLLLLAGGLWGAALATKANALFLPAVILPVLILGERPEPWRGQAARLLLRLLESLLVGVVVLVAAWPWLWPAPAERFVQHLSYVGGQVFQVRAESLHPPWRALLDTTPPAFLGLAAFGLAVLAVRACRRERTALLVWSWVLVVFGRLLLPGAVNFDGVRHFLELFPALALAAGTGASVLWQQATRRLRLGPAAAALALLSLCPGTLALAVARSHPFEIADWSPLVGGLAGARQRGLPQAGDYWGLSYRLGLRYLERHALPGAVLAVPIVQHAVAVTAQSRLRPDIGLLAITVPHFPMIPPERLAVVREVAQQRPVYVMFVLRADWANELTRECSERLRPIAEWRHDGVPVLQIYRYPATRSPMNGEPR